MIEALGAFLAKGLVAWILVLAGVAAVACTVTVIAGVLRGSILIETNPEQLLYAIGPSAPPRTLLGLIGQNATALGLFASVIGLGEAFDGLGGAAAAATVGPAIAKALSATAVGVGLSIGCSFIAAILDDLARDYVQQCIAKLEELEKKRPEECTTDAKPTHSAPAMPTPLPGRPNESQVNLRVARVRAGCATVFALQPRTGELRFVRIDAGVATPTLVPVNEVLQLVRECYPQAVLQQLWKGPAWADYPESDDLPSELRQFLSRLPRTAVR